MAAPKGNNYGKKWKKGQSGNPSGLSKQVADFMSNCREFTPEAYEYLVEIARDVDNKSRAWAIEMLLSYGVGKPSEKLHLKGKHKLIVEVRTAKAPGDDD